MEMKKAPRTCIIHYFTRCLSLEGRMVKGKDPQRNRKVLLAESWGNGSVGKVLAVKARDLRSNAPKPVYKAV